MITGKAMSKKEWFVEWSHIVENGFLSLLLYLDSNEAGYEEATSKSGPGRGRADVANVGESKNHLGFCHQVAAVVSKK